MTTRVRLSELRDAFTWVSVDGPFENVAYVSRASGQIWLVTDYDDVGDEAPEDADDESLYLQVPSQKELDLGRSLVLRFAQEHLPERFDDIRGFFQRRGAYAKFKALLDGCGMLPVWSAYEANGVEQALREWAADNDVELL